MDDYDAEQRVLSRKATYPDIIEWVKATYGVHVKRVDIARAKQRCGLPHKESARPVSPGYKPDRIRPDLEDMVIEAFRHFGMIPDD